MSAQPIPPSVYEWAEIFCDENRHIEDDRELVARAYMLATQAITPPAAQVVGMTQRQAAVLNFIRSFSDEHSHSPSYQQIADGIGLRSKSRVCDAVAQLEERGLLHRLRGRSRSIAIVGQVDNVSTAHKMSVEA